MKKTVLILTLTFAALPAQAQTALQRCGNQVANLAVANDVLAEQLTAAQARVKELEDKYEPKPKPGK